MYTYCNSKLSMHVYYTNIIGHYSDLNLHYVEAINLSESNVFFLLKVVYWLCNDD